MENGYQKVVAVVPSLNPDEKLAKVVKGLLDVGFERVIAVDDGSSEEHKARFKDCAAMPGVTLLVHEVNKGKGAAMKTAFAYILENMPDALGAVTVDGDAQHHPEDCKKCAERMTRERKVVLGVRDFSQKDVPFRSMAGNRITCAVFRIFCGMKLSDTQTGLRAFPMSVLPQMLQVRGERYEYETRMLLDFKTECIPYTEEVIRTIYIEENQTSHYRVIRDSFRVYKMILGHFVKYTGVSIMSYLLEYGCLAALTWLLIRFTDLDILRYTAIAYTIARLISSVFNFICNRSFVFGTKSKTKNKLSTALLKYYTICLPMAAIGLFCQLLAVKGVSVWGFLPNAVEPYANLLVHPILQIVMFIFTYILQREWVFRGEKRKEKQK